MNLPLALASLVWLVCLWPSSFLSVYSQPVYLYEGKERSKVLLPKGLLLLLFVDKHSGLTE